jgi:hypothetical protein
MFLWTMLILAVQDGSSESKAVYKAALEHFKAAVHSNSESARVAAIDSLEKPICPEIIGALGAVLTGDSDRVRVAAAKALGGTDHPKALEVLISALPTSELSKPVFESTVRALQTLDWEAGAEPLNALLSKYHEKGMLDELQPVVQALGSLGSPSSVDLLLRLLEHVENEGRGGRAGKVRGAGNPKLLALEAPVKAALQAITGGNEPDHRKWKDWWAANRERLLASAVVVYRCRATGKRWEQKSSEPGECPHHDKSQKDGQVVKVRLRPRP